MKIRVSASRRVTSLKASKLLVLALVSVPVLAHAHLGKGRLQEFHVDCEFLLLSNSAMESCIWLKEKVDGLRTNLGKAEVAEMSMPGNLPSPAPNGEVRFTRDPNQIDLYFLEYDTADGSVQRQCLHVPPIFIWKRYRKKVGKFSLMSDINLEDPSKISVGGIVLDSPLHRTYISIQPLPEHSLKISLGVDRLCDGVLPSQLRGSSHLVVGQDGKIYCRYQNFTATF